jgi:hypothetical protein
MPTFQSNNAATQPFTGCNQLTIGFRYKLYMQQVLILYHIKALTAFQYIFFQNERSKQYCD